MVNRNQKTKYYFDSELLNALNLPNDKYYLDYIINKVIYNCNQNNNIINTIINNSKYNNEIDCKRLKQNIMTFITKFNHEKIPNYLDKGYHVKCLTI